MKKHQLLPLVVAAAAAYFALFGGDYGFLAFRGLERQREAEAAEVETLRAEVENLRARRDSLESDSATIERIARERYGMIRPGERLYRFTECAPAAAGEETGQAGRSGCAEPAAQPTDRGS